MVKGEELKARIKDHFRFEKQEVSFLIPAVLLTAFIFSFRDWGETQLNLALGLRNFFLVLLVAALSFVVRLSWQKIFALKEGYKAEFKGWWAGLIIALVAAFLTMGKVPLVLIGGVVASFMVRQRLGEFRYGFSYLDNAKISYHGIVANIHLALLFSLGLYFFPDSYFFSKGLMLNWIMALCASFPLPQLDGLNIYFGSRVLYYVTLVMIAVFGVLLLTKIQIGLILAVFILAVADIIMMLLEP